MAGRELALISEARTKEMKSLKAGNQEKSFRRRKTGRNTFREGRCRRIGGESPPLLLVGETFNALNFGPLTLTRHGSGILDKSKIGTRLLVGLHGKILPRGQEYRERVLM